MKENFWITGGGMVPGHEDRYTTRDFIWCIYDHWGTWKLYVIQTKLNLGYLKGNMQGLSESTVFEVVIQEKPSEDGDLWFKK